MQTSKILVVDDEPFVLDFVRVALETRGLHIVTAQDAEEALQILEIQHTEIAAVLSDVRMPGMSGLRLIRKVKEKAPTISVALMSGEMGEETPDPEIPFLQKPFQLRALVRTIETLLGEHERLRTENQLQIAMGMKRAAEVQAALDLSANLTRKLIIDQTTPETD